MFVLEILSAIKLPISRILRRDRFKWKLAQCPPLHEENQCADLLEHSGILTLIRARSPGKQVPAEIQFEEESFGISDGACG